MLIFPLYRLKYEAKNKTTHHKFFEKHLKKVFI